MSESEMVERVARAIWNHHLCEECVVSSKKPLPSGCCCYDAARAAIEAMREPTFDPDGVSYHQGMTRLDWWRAMIDAILAPPTDRTSTTEGT